MEYTLSEAMGAFCSLVIILMILADRSGTLRKRGTGMIPLMMSMTTFCILSTCIDLSFGSETTLGWIQMLVYSIIHLIAYLLTGVLLVRFYVKQTHRDWNVRNWWMLFLIGLIVFLTYALAPPESTSEMILNVLFDVIMVLPFAAVGLDSALKAHDAATYFERRTHLMIVLFVTPIILSFILDRWKDDLPFTEIGFAASILIMMMNLQSQTITLDPLTQITNRSQFEKIIGSRMDSKDSVGKLHFGIMDMDHFKSINDRFGHSEGDRALIDVADILKRACGNTGAIAARFAGDEFVIMYEGDRKVLDEVCERIHGYCDEANRDRPYHLGVSIGIVRYDGDVNFRELFEMADREMFRVKQERRKDLPKA